MQHVHNKNVKWTVLLRWPTVTSLKLLIFIHWRISAHVGLCVWFWASGWCCGCVVRVCCEQFRFTRYWTLEWESGPVYSGHSSPCRPGSPRRTWSCPTRTRGGDRRKRVNIRLWTLRCRIGVILINWLTYDFAKQNLLEHTAKLWMNEGPLKWFKGFHFKLVVRRFVNPHFGA